MLAALLYLDEATKENGCLQVIPRQHRGYLNHDTDDGIFAGMVTEDLSDGSRGEAVSLPAPAGSVIFMHSLTPHSSLPNRSDHGRRTMIFEYKAADALEIQFPGSVVRTKTEPVLHRTAVFSAGAILKTKPTPKAGHLVRRQRAVQMPPFKDMNASTLDADRFYHD